MTTSTRRRLLGFTLGGAVTAVASLPPSPVDAQPAGFDHSHTAWTALLRKHVRLVRGGQATQVAYAGVRADRAALKAYLDSLSAVTPATFAGWGRAERQAFLINAYNAFTVELILTRYPELKSIKYLGSLLNSPWKPKWIPLLGTNVSLDDIEHAMLRKRGDHDDPRVHFAVNCASIGCPALSKIFDWYGEDFRLGHRGIGSLQGFAARYVDQLADAPADRERIRAGAVDIAFTDYDWALNDAR